MLKSLSKDSKVFLAGHRGLVGSAIHRELQKRGYTKILTRTHSELDLLEQSDVRNYLKLEKPDAVIIAAAKVGGILANDQLRGDFILENLEIQTNLISGAFKVGVKKLVFLGSSCIYPKDSPQPIPESALLTGPLEKTNDAYAIAKIAGITLCRSLKMQYGVDYISLMPTNMYGPGDNYHPTKSHVIPGMIRRFHEGKLFGATAVQVWGTGRPLREFMFSSDLADATVFCLENYDGLEHLNIGTGEEVSIAQLAILIKEVVGFKGEIQFDSAKPDGMPRKLMDSSRLRALGWRPKVLLRDGLKLAYEDFLSKES